MSTNHAIQTKRLIFVALAVITFLSFTRTPSVKADLFFCEGDPLVSINHHQVHIYDGVLASVDPIHLTGTATMEITVPYGIEAHLVSNTSVGFTQTITIRHGPVLRVHVTSTIYADGSYATTLWTDPEDRRSVYGTTNVPLTLIFPVPFR